MSEYMAKSDAWKTETREHHRMQIPSETEWSDCDKTNMQSLYIIRGFAFVLSTQPNNIREHNYPSVNQLAMAVSKTQYRRNTATLDAQYGRL